MSRSVTWIVTTQHASAGLSLGEGALCSPGSARAGLAHPGVGRPPPNLQASSAVWGPPGSSHSFSLSNFFEKLGFFVNCSVLRSLFNAVGDRMEILETDSTFISQIFFISH